jgi:ribose-phosphate pyrophosphokinase
MLWFSLDAEGALAPALAAALGIEPAPHEDRAFEDGEHKLRPLVDPAGADCVVLHALHGDARLSPHDKIVRLLMFAATLRDHGAARITALVPYLAYARKDRQTKPFDPLGLRYVAQLAEGVGIDRLVVLEAHNVSALQNAFRCPVSHLDAHRVFDPLLPGWAGNRPVAVASPDPGGVKRAQLWREAAEAALQRPVGFAMVDKRRSAGVVSSDRLVAGDVAGATVLLLDDLIASGETMRRAARALREAGAVGVVACAAHGLFTSGAEDALADPAIDEVVVTDSVPPQRLAPDSAVRAKLRIVSAAPLFAGSVAALARA